MSTFRPDAEAVNDRMKLIMDRLVAARLRRNPDLVGKACECLRETRDAAGDQAQWWMDEWLEVLARGSDEVCRFITARTQYSRQMANASPLYNEAVVGDMFHDVQYRKRILKKARDGLILLHRRKKQDGRDDDSISMGIPKTSL